MRPTVRYGLALAVGTLAAVTSFVATNGTVESTRTWFVTGLNAAVWTGAVALYIPVYERFDGAPADSESASVGDSVKWGGIAGGGASVGVAGTGLLLVEGLPGWYVGAVCLFVMGLFLLAMAVGMGTVATNFADGQPARSPQSVDAEPAND